MSDTIYDAVIIGGGPGGSTAATFLARAGRRVIVLEKEHFPRFHIGESLLPYNRGIFDELGILPELERAGLIKKTGAQFHLGNGSKSLFLVFRNGRFTREPEAFQVERATFDDMLLRFAEKSGAEVREGWTVSRFSSDASGVTVEAGSDTGEQRSFRGRFLIDASGRGNLTGNQEGIREIHPKLKKLAVFGHFADVRLDDGEKAGDTVIIRLEDKWFGSSLSRRENQRWLRDGPGGVCPRERNSGRHLHAHLAGKPAFARADAQRAFARFDAHHERFLISQPKLRRQPALRVGDAAGFMDPIFSAGVYLACYSAKLAAKIVDTAVRENSDGRAALRSTTG
jgi:FADH2-dependent halogenase